MSKAKPFNPLTMTDEELIKHCDKQVQALRMALDMIECEKHDRRHVRWAIVDALKEWKPALTEQPAQEPVAWMSPSWIDPDTRGWQSDSFESIPIEGWLPLYTSPPAQQEPVAWWNQSKDSVSTDPVHRHNSDCQPLYTAPQSCSTCEALARAVMMDQTGKDV